MLPPSSSSVATFWLSLVNFFCSKISSPPRKAPPRIPSLLENFTPWFWLFDHYSGTKRQNHNQNLISKWKRKRQKEGGIIEGPGVASARETYKDTNPCTSPQAEFLKQWKIGMPSDAWSQGRKAPNKSSWALAELGSQEESPVRSSTFGRSNMAATTQIHSEIFQQWLQPSSYKKGPQRYKI